jgi:hypothetical protein
MITAVILAHRQAGGSSHRQLDLVTVRGAESSGQTGFPAAWNPMGNLLGDSHTDVLLHTLWTTT